MAGIRRGTQRHRTLTSGIHQLNKLARRRFGSLRQVRYELRRAQAALKRSGKQRDVYAGTFFDHIKEMERRNEVEKPWSQLTEREPAASGPLLAAYDAVDALEHRLELQVEMLTGAITKLTELWDLHDYATSCDGRIAELQTELEDAERDWDELDSRHQEQSTVVQSQSRRIKDLEQTLACTKAVTAAFDAREKENQSLRESRVSESAIVC